MSPAYLRGLERGFIQALKGVNTLCITVLIGCFVIFVYRSVQTPFYGPSTTDWWVFAPDGKTVIDKPPIIEVSLGEPLPVGRTLCLTHMVSPRIYKELDAVVADGHTYPLSDPGGTDRILHEGCQTRISPTMLPKPGPGAPPPGNYTFNVWFTVPTNAVAEILGRGPLIVGLHPVKVLIK